MKTPPFLLFATLAFWGWESGFVVAGALMGLAIEVPRWVNLRWELTEKDFSRIWTFCSLVLLASVVFAFTASQGAAELRGMIRNPSFQAQRAVGLAGQRTAADVMRWLPMVYFLMLGAQALSVRQAVPLEVISFILQKRWKKAIKQGAPPPKSRDADLSYPYFGVCLFASGIHRSEDAIYFWGLVILVGWALWPRRPRCFALALWAVSLAAAITVGYYGQRGIGGLNRYLGNLNPTWLLNLSHRGFDHAQSKLTLGQIGRVKGSGSIVVRVHPRTGSEAPALLREASYNTDHGLSWQSGIEEKDFERLDPERDAETDTSFALLLSKPAPREVTISCYLPGGKGLLPLPTGTSRIENLVSFYLCKNAMGAVLETGPGLVIFDAYYGPGVTLDAAPTNTDLYVPARETPAVDTVIREARLEGQPLETAMALLRNYFQTNYAYSLWQESSIVTTTNETPLSHFLLKTRKGHCEYFATSTVLLLRQLGFQARYAVGYAVNERTGSDYVVRQRDAHAWCLVWHNGTWEDFDTTPGSWVEMESSRGSPFQFIGDIFQRAWFEFSKFRWGQSQVRRYILWGLVPVLAILLYQILARLRRQRKPQAGSGGPVAWPGLDSEVYTLERLLTRRGFVRGPSEPLSTWLRRAANDARFTSLRPAMEGLLRLHYRYRFDPQGIQPEERVALRDQARDCLEEATRLATR